MCWFLCWPRRSNQELIESLITQENEDKEVQEVETKILVSVMEVNQEEQNQESKGASNQEQTKGQTQQSLKTQERQSQQRKKRHPPKNINRVRFKHQQNLSPKLPISNTGHKYSGFKRGQINGYIGEQKKQGPINRQTLKIEERELKSQNLIPSEKQQQCEINRIFENCSNFQYIFTNNNIESPIFMFYKCTKIIGFKEPLHYHLEKTSDKLTAIIAKSSSFKTKTETLTKFSQNIWVINFSHESGVPGVLDDTSVDTNSLKLIQWKKIERIILLLDNFRKVKHIQQYILEATKHMTQREKKKLIYLFPTSISIENLSNIMHSIYSDEMKKLDIHRYTSEYSFDIRYFGTGDLGMMVQLSCLDPAINSHKLIFYNSIKTSLSILGKHFNNEQNYFILRQFYSLIKRRPSTDLLGLRKLFLKSSQQFRIKIREVRNWDNYQLLSIQNENIKANFPWSYFDNQIIISQVELERIFGHLDSEQKNSPQVEDESLQWDFNLTQSDIHLCTNINQDNQTEDAEQKDREFRSAWGIKEDDFMIEMASPIRKLQKKEKQPAKKQEIKHKQIKQEQITRLKRKQNSTLYFVSNQPASRKKSWGQ